MNMTTCAGLISAWHEEDCRRQVIAKALIQAGTGGGQRQHRLLLPPVPFKQLIPADASLRQRQTHIQAGAVGSQGQRRLLLLRAHRHHQRRLALPVARIDVDAALAQQRPDGIHLHNLIIRICQVAGHIWRPK